MYPVCCFFLRTMLRQERNKICRPVQALHWYTVIIRSVMLMILLKNAVSGQRRKGLTDMVAYLDCRLVRGSYKEDFNIKCGAEPFCIEAGPVEKVSQDIPIDSIDDYYRMIKRVQEKSENGKLLWPRSCFAVGGANEEWT